MTTATMPARVTEQGEAHRLSGMEKMLKTIRIQRSFERMRRALAERKIKVSA